MPKNWETFQIGTYTIALCAKELNKPVYVMCESFKFIRLYPLNQQDLPEQFRFHASTINSKKDLSQVHPLVDYTPPVAAYFALHRSWNFDAIRCQR